MCFCACSLLSLVPWYTYQYGCGSDARYACAYACYGCSFGVNMALMLSMTVILRNACCECEYGCDACYGCEYGADAGYDR